MIPLRKAVQPGAPPIVAGDTRCARRSTSRGMPSPRGRKIYRGESQLYVATPALLGYLGIDPATIDPSADFLADPSVPTDELVIPSFASRRSSSAVTNVQRIDSRQALCSARRAARTPPTFITLNGLRRHGWKQIPAGWLVESSRPLTSDQIAAARDARGGRRPLDRDSAQEQPSLATAMAIATAAGALLALAILAMTVGLIRSESAGDLRTLTATGATSRIRRTLTATTAGALALLGALLGVAGAYVVLAGDVPRRPRLSESTCRSSTSPSRSSASRWPPPRPAGSSPAASRPPSPGRSSIDPVGAPA